MPDPVSVVFCWSAFSGYMASCWRALSDRPGIRLKVIAHEADADAGAGFSEHLLGGLDVSLLDAEQRRDEAYVRRLVRDAEPAVVALSGWAQPAYRALAAPGALEASKFVLCMDNPWCGGPRQRLARHRHRVFLHRMDHAMVAGERAFQFARRLGFEDSRITTGVYGFDESLRSTAADAPLQDRRTFLFLGRYAPEKGLSLLLKSYQNYRRAHAEPWRLLCCGGGALKPLLADQEGVEDAGFIQPDQLDARFAEASCLVLPSLFEPWGVVIAEAATAGLPVICSRSCGASVDVVRHLYNGYLTGTNAPGDLTRAMSWVHNQGSAIEACGQRSRELAAPFSASCWADRWEWLAAELLKEPD